MEYLREYASNIIIISVISTIFEIIIPEGENKKYVLVVIGLLVMLVIMQPLKALTEIKGRFSYTPSFEIETNSTLSQNDMVADRFEKDLALTVKEKVAEKFSMDINCTIKTKRNENGEILAIETIEVEPYSSQVAEYVALEIGVGRDVIKGEKND